MPIDYQSNIVSVTSSLYQFTYEASCEKFCKAVGGSYSLNYSTYPPKYNAWIGGQDGRPEYRSAVSWLSLNSHMRS